MLNSLFFRLLSMIAKFTFIIVAAKYLHADVVALFGGVNSLVLLFVYFLGFDLYIGTSRALKSSDNLRFHTLLSNQFIVSIILALGLFILLAFTKKSTPTLPLFPLLLLVITELLAQELYRLLISTGDYIKANILFFIKIGSWSIFGALAIAQGVITDIDQILTYWFIGTLLGVIYGLLAVKQHVSGFKFTPNLNIFFKFIKKNSYIFSSSFALLMIGNFDKIMLGLGNASEGAAGYFFFSSLAGACMTLIYSTVINPNYAKLVAAKNNKYEIFRLIKLIGLVALLLGSAAMTSIFFTIDILLNLIDRAYLFTYVTLLYIFLLNLALTILCLMPHFFLLANERDKEIAIASWAAVIIQLSSIIPLYNLFGTYGVALCTTLALSIMFTIKAYYASILWAAE